MPDFVAVDGEADEQGRYILLCDSTGRSLHRPDGIRTREAFEWLLRLGGKRVIVCFGLNYDVNQWIEGLSRKELEYLADKGQTIHQLRYKLDWWPTKSFTIVDGKTSRRVKVCEVFGFFQTSFVKALENWGLKSPREITVMKGKRGTFTASELERVRAYCLAECRLLVQLMQALDEACVGAGCRPDSWIGAGAIASKLMNLHGVKQHHQPDADIFPRETVEGPILGAYFGGRVELLAQGIMPVCQTRDIRSAYPAAAVALPSMAGAKVVPVKRYKPGLPAIWRVRWDLGAEYYGLAPFPVRNADASICYPAAGEGFYHAVEVDSARNIYGQVIQPVEGWRLAVRNGEAPFDFIPQLFAHRARLKAAGNPAEKAIKLGLNSVYGKLAQGYGHRPFQNYWWAGYITAATRARMLALAHRSRGVVMISTDGLFAASPGNRGSSRSSLGSWEPDTLDGLFAAQPGVYAGIRGGQEFVKSRGFFAREVDYGALRELWLARGPEGVYHYDSRRFIGLKVALHRKDFGIWRQWITDRRAINLYPQRKRFRDGVPARVPAGMGGMAQLWPIPGPLTSLPYTPKESLYDDPTDDQLENLILDDQPRMEGFEG